MDTFGIGTLVITVAVIFIAYRIGLINFAQQNMERVTNLTDRSLEIMDVESHERHTRKLGKVKAKLMDQDIIRSNSRDIKKLLKSAGRKAKTEPQAAES